MNTNTKSRTSIVCVDIGVFVIVVGRWLTGDLEKLRRKIKTRASAVITNISKLYQKSNEAIYITGISLLFIYLTNK